MTHARLCSPLAALMADHDMRVPTSLPSPEVPVFVISIAAELTGLHPQTLRTYDRLGLVSPGRSGGGGRRYSWRDVEQLREVARLTAQGIGLEGVRRILELESDLESLRLRIAGLESDLQHSRAAPGANPYLPEPLPATSRAIVLWRSRGRSGS